MSTTVQDVMTALEEFAPFHTQLSFDNAGLLVGSPSAPVSRIGVALDATPATVEAASASGAQVLVSHHPVIFHPLHSLPTTSAVYKAAAAGLAVIAAHTNLDAAAGGVNDCLAERLGLGDVTPLALPESGDAPPMGRLGRLAQPLAAEDFAGFLAERLHTRVKYVPVNRPIQTVAVCGGAGEDLLLPALHAGADALVTAEVRHHNLLLAAEHSFMLVDAGHYETERVVVPPLCRRLAERLGLPVTPLFQPLPVRYR